MFERFTDRARRTVVLAQEEARLLKHNYIGTEHILLGLLYDSEGVAAAVLRHLGITRDSARTEVRRLVAPGSVEPSGHIPFTKSGKKTLEQALRAALELGHNYIGTEHILLGLVRVGEGTAAEALAGMGADAETIRVQVITELAEAEREPLHGGIRSTGDLEAARVAAFDSARAKGHARVGTDHLLLVLLDQKDSAAVRVLRDQGIDLDALTTQLLAVLDEAENSTDP